jgi:uncharacterized protein YoaH (UPF0181 family)
MEKEEMLERIAQLEFQNDQLSAELEYIDKLLRSVGFSDGLVSVKAAAQELSEYEKNQNRIFEEGMPDEPPGLD